LKMSKSPGGFPISASGSLQFPEISDPSIEYFQRKRQTRKTTMERLEGLQISSQNDEDIPLEGDFTFAPNIESTRVNDANITVSTNSVVSNEASCEESVSVQVVASTPVVPNIGMHVTFQYDEAPVNQTSLPSKDKSIEKVRINRFQNFPDVMNLQEGDYPDELKKIITELDKTRENSDCFKKPAVPKQKRKPASTCDPSQIYGYKDLKPLYNYYSTTSGRLTPKSMPALSDISNRFCSKMLKHLSKSLEEQGRTTAGLNDLKELMKDLGVLDDDDQKNFNLYCLIRDHIPNFEDRKLILPFLFNDRVSEHEWNHPPQERPVRLRKQN
jgi:hypothetical protein